MLKKHAVPQGTHVLAFLSAPRTFSMGKIVHGGGPPLGSLGLQPISHSSELGRRALTEVICGLTFLESNNLNYRLLISFI